MTEGEVEAVAAELAKAGGLGWHPGRERGPLKHVADRYRDRARLAIAALDRLRAGRRSADPTDLSIESEQAPSASRSPSRPTSGSSLEAGSMVLYRPPGDRRAYPCRIDKVRGSRVYLVPDLKTCTGWIDVEHLSPRRADGAHDK